MRVKDPARVLGYRVAFYFLVANVTLSIIGYYLFGAPRPGGLATIQGLIAFTLYRRGPNAWIAAVLLPTFLALYVSLISFSTFVKYWIVTSSPHWLHAGAFALALWGKPSRRRIVVAIAAWLASLLAAYVLPYALFR